MQNGFMRNKGITGVIFVVRQMLEKCRAKGKRMYFNVEDLVKGLTGLYASWL